MRDTIQLIKLEDLYTALLLGGAQKSTSSGKYQVEFLKERYELLSHYLDRYGLDHTIFQFVIEEDNPYIVVKFENNLIVARIYKEWIFNNEVRAISPMHLNVNVYLLWISLFAEKRKHVIRLSNKHLSLDAKRTLASLFEEQMNMQISMNSIQFVIHDVKSLILLAIRTKRPNYEIHLFTQFLSDRDYNKLVGLLKERIFTRGGLAYEYY